MYNMSKFHQPDADSMVDLMKAIFGDSDDDNEVKRNPVEDVLRMRLLGSDGNGSVHDFLTKTDFGKKESIAVNIKEDDTSYQITAMMPGVKKEDIKISISDKNDLTISADVKTDKTEKSENYVRREISEEKKERVIHFKEEIDRDKVSASLENGMLNITLSKVDKSALVKHIEIK